ncbi:MAG: GNAT family N-acetyltransferase [Aeromicrobium sp.]
MSDFLLRRARPDEADAVGALTVASYDADGHLTNPDGSFDHEYAEWLADGGTRARDGILVVAVDVPLAAPGPAPAPGDELLGTVTWCPPGSPFREISTRDDQGEFRTLSVAPEARGRRVGSALVDWCLDEARGTGLAEVLLSSLPTMAAAHRLYVSRGFVRRPELDWSPFPDVVLWAFALRLVGE